MQKIKLTKKLKSHVEDFFIQNFELNLKMYSSSIHLEDHLKISIINYLLVNFFKPIIPKHKIFSLKDQLITKYYKEEVTLYFEEKHNLKNLYSFEEILKIDEDNIFNKDNLIFFKLLFPLFALIDPKYFKLFSTIFEENNQNNKYPVFLNNLYSNYLQNLKNLQNSW